jgi:molecular chaperone DnaK
LVTGLIKRTISPREKAIKDARISKGDIGEVILVGGMTRILKVIDTVKTVLEKEPTRSVNPVKQLF